MTRRSDRHHDPKTEALKEYRALHPHPERVRDALFRGDDFFDPRDLVQVRYEMLRRVQVEGRSVTETAAAFGFSRQSFYKIQADMAREGLVGLLPRKRGPKHPRKLKADVMAVVLEELEADSSLSGAALARRLEERLGLHVHPRSIERALSRREKKRRSKRSPLSLQASSRRSR